MHFTSPHSCRNLCCVWHKNTGIQIRTVVVTEGGLKHCWICPPQLKFLSSCTPCVMAWSVHNNLDFSQAPRPRRHTKLTSQGGNEQLKSPQLSAGGTGWHLCYCQHLLLCVYKNNSRKVKIELQEIQKITYEKSTANIMVENLNLSQLCWTKTRISALTTSIPPCTGCSSKVIMQGKKMPAKLKRKK